MDEPVKQLMDKLNKISTIASDAMDVVEALKTKENLIVFEGRRQGKTFTAIDILRKNLESINYEANKPIVLIVGTEMGEGLVNQHIQLLEMLKEKNMRVICINRGSMTFAQVEEHKEYNHQWEGIEPGIRGRFEVERLLQSFADIHPLEDLVQLEKDFKYQDRKIPIVSKSSKKGKNNQCGSKFHR